jgi:hypothetical protein
MKKITWLIPMLILMSCHTSQITSSWKTEDTVAKKYNKVLVLGLIGEPDRTIWEKMEQHMAGDLKALGYNAVTSIEAYGPKAFENMAEATAIKLLYSEDIDAVITIVLLDEKKEGYYAPAHVRRQSMGIYHDHFWRYYSTMYDRVYTPGYYTTDAKYFWESNLYDLNESKLLYFAQSQSFDPESTTTLAHTYGKMIVKDMLVKNVLHKSDSVLKAF